MKNLVRWAISNTPAMNTIMVASLLVGVLGLSMMRREVFPEFELEIVLVRVPYPGASPEETEEAICQKIEEAVRAIDGIKKQTSVAGEGLGTVVLELDPSTNAEKTLNEVRSEVDRISTFPAQAEDPDVEQLTFRSSAIKVAVLGPPGSEGGDERPLRDVAERVRDDLISLGDVSQANLTGAKAYQIDVEIPEETLREYGLTLQSVAQTIRRENLELPGGTIKTASQDVLVKGDAKAVVGERIAKIPLVTTENGVVLTVDDLGEVQDDFADTTSVTRINGRPGLIVSVDRTSDEDLLAVADTVVDYVETKELPPGYELLYYGDRSIDVRDRMDLLSRNGLQGLVLVLLVLALFLNSRLAFWVAMGIPVSILGACAVLYFAGQTLNMLTMFAFLMALGIVVDDAIVIGENIFTHREMGKSRWRAAIDGTVEVIPSVSASVTTTVIAFMPLFFVAGVMGKFIACMPLAMIAMLLISLLESMFILPCHLGHEDHEGTLSQRALSAVTKWNPFARWTVGLVVVGLAYVLEFLLGPVHVVGLCFNWLSQHMNTVLDAFAERLYLPFLRQGLRNPVLVLAGGFFLLALTFGAVRGGHVSFEFFPKLDSRDIAANITFPNGTPAREAEAATQKVEAALFELDEQLQREYGKSFIKVVQRSVGYGERNEGGAAQAAETSGSHLGGVSVELIDTEERPLKSDEIVARWRDTAGEISGVETLTFGSRSMGPGGKAIEFKLLARADDVESLEAAIEKCKAKLETYAGVYDVADDSSPGKPEYRLTVKEDAVAMGVPLGDMAETVRASYFGEEVMRLQRGRHEVKLMVRYPRERRRSAGDFEDIRVRTGDGSERPLTELANVEVARGPSEINRVDQLRSITVTADLDESKANATEVVADFRANFMPDLLAEHPEVSPRWEGQQEQTAESFRSLAVGYLIAMFVMYVLLTLQFRSYFQPVLVMAIIPFGVVGAVLGHYVMDLPLTLFSIFGLVALTGVVVNDSIVLIDFINRRMQDGLPTEEALLEAGRRRLRPVLLTSVTTVAGLIPLLMEKSFQAQILIPMAVSLAFGLMVATGLVLFMVPVFYRIYAGIAGGGAHGPGAEHGELDTIDEPLDRTANTDDSGEPLSNGESTHPDHTEPNRELEPMTVG